jgi:hypothetical protein
MQKDNRVYYLILVNVFSSFFDIHFIVCYSEVTKIETTPIPNGTILTKLVNSYGRLPTYLDFIYIQIFLAAIAILKYSHSLFSYSIPSTMCTFLYDMEK